MPTENVKDAFIAGSTKRARDHKDVDQALRAWASQERLTYSEALRYLLREALRSRGLWPPEAGSGQAGGG